MLEEVKVNIINLMEGDNNKKYRKYERILI